jgi:hypothetical protein
MHIPEEYGHGTHRTPKQTKGNMEGVQMGHQTSLMTLPSAT